MTASPEPPPSDFEALFHQAPCGYLTTDDSSHITAVNDTFLRWSGYSRPDLLGSRLQSFMPVGDQILYSTHCLPQLGITGAVAEIAIEIVGAGGERHAALLSASRSQEALHGRGVVRVIIFGAHASEAQRAKVESELQHLALHDALTGLPNRAGLKARVGSGTPGGAGGPGILAVLFIDLDGFKAVNDSLGHAAGDELLICIARRLRATSRATSTVARLSGDEFIVVDSFAHAGEVTALAGRLLEVMQAPMMIEGLEIVTTASIGAAAACGQTDTLEELVRRADIAMYRAKGLGRNRGELHCPAESDPTADRLRVLGELRYGISGGALRLHYQPRVDLATGHVRSVEALVRWERPVRGLLLPADFIEMAAESGLVRPLGAWVLNEALKQAGNWREEGPGPAGLGFSVNLSARQLNDPQLVGLIEAALRLWKCEPSLLILEITETALMSDPDAALRSLTALKSLGVELAVDDFGTGYSSLTYLKKFPVDELKIDRSFITGLGSDPADSAIVASCIALAHAVGIRAVAEGVETPEQVQALKTMGCDLAQGFHFARPLPAATLKKWLNEKAEERHPAAREARA